MADSCPTLSNCRCRPQAVRGHSPLYGREYHFEATRASVQTIVRTLARPTAQFFGVLVSIIAQAIWISNNSPMLCIH
jgi:hypothetical protein